MNHYKEKVEQLDFVQKVFDACGIRSVETQIRTMGYNGQKSFGQITDLLEQGFRVVEAVNVFNMPEAEYYAREYRSIFILERLLSHEERLMLYRKYLKEEQKEDHFFNLTKGEKK